MSTAPTPSGAIAPAIDAITETDIRRDIFALAGDTMRGRLAGTLDELRATTWIAERARDAGLQPAGEDSTFYQWWPLRHDRLSENSQLTIGGRAVRVGTEALLVSTQPANIDLPIVFVSDSSALVNADVRGKAVAMELPATAMRPQGEFTVSTNFRATVNQLVRTQANMIARAGGSAAILLSSRDSLVQAFDAAAVEPSRSGFGFDSAGRPSGFPFGPAPRVAQAGSPGNALAQNVGAANAVTVPTIWVRHDMLGALKSPGARLTALVFRETSYHPSANVIGVVRGTDPRLANEYVVLSGHQDHDGVRYPVNGDSIWNGADDNATASVALLAAARAFAKHPAPRSVLFVWHGAEEKGLLGSRWFVSHPTVPRAQLIAVLNADMIGRNHPDSAALLGSQPPHKNSNALVEAALRANAELTRFKLDTLWDQPTHPQGWYFRSDHLPYARAGIPAIFFTTLLHPDYHTPRDEPSRIDVPKLTKVARWMYATAWLVATAPERPDVIPAFKLER